MIEARGLTKDYGLHRAVDDVSFTIQTGEIVGLLGPNGSGKTTIMRMLTGFFSPTAGGCSIAGIDIGESSREARKQIGYLPEQVALYPDMKVAGFLTFVAKVREVTGSVVESVEAAIDICGLTDVAGRYIGNLSRGYRQRVGIAQAIIHQPQVLILDEPTVGLDPRQIVEIRGLIRKLSGLATVLLSTHILPEVSLTCQRVLILDKGRLIAKDTAEGLMEKTAGQGETLLRVQAPEGEVLAVARACDGVESVEVSERGTGGELCLTIRAAVGSDVRPAVGRAVIERGWALHELSPKLLSLEELFVRILDGAHRSDG